MTAEPVPTAARGNAAITPGGTLALLAMQGVLFVLAGAGLWLWSGRAVGDFVSFSLGEAMVGLGFGAALIVLAAALFHGFPKTGEHLVRLQSETHRFLGAHLGWPAIVLISLVAGISEEAAMRGGLQTLLGDHIGPVGAIAIASALFAALHLAKPLITALLLAIGMLFGVVYWHTGSLLAVMIAHVVYDIWALRYLNREMHRLGLFDVDPAPSAPLANPADPG